MRNLKQTHKATCGPIAVAMITGIPKMEAIHEMDKLHSRRWKKIYGKNWRKIVAESFNTPTIKYLPSEIKFMRTLLNKYGVSLRPRRVPYPNFRMRDLKTIHLVNIRWKGDSRFRHWIVWDPAKQRALNLDKKNKHSYIVNYMYEVRYNDRA